MNKDYILKNLSYLSPEVIADAIIRNIISLEEIIESGILGKEKINDIHTILLRKWRKRTETDPGCSFEEFLMGGVPVVLPLPRSPRKQSSDVFHSNSFERGVLDFISGVAVGAIDTLVCKRSGERRQEEGQSRVARQDNKVYSAVYAPASAELNNWFKVPVFLYNKSEAELVNQRALEMDEKTHLMEKKPLSLKIKLGTQVEAEINVYDEGVQVSKTRRTLTWNGELTSAVFQVKAIDPSLRSIAGDITLSTAGIPLGEFSFNTDIVIAPVEKEELELGSARSFTKAFISYAHKDSDLAVNVKNTLRGLGYKCFFDRDSLAPGDLFEEKIMKSIEESDVFVLLWSKNSAQSEYVEKEYLHALPLAYPPKPEPAKLDFRPFFIDQPHTDPPVALKDINFSEWSKQ